MPNEDVEKINEEYVVISNEERDAIIDLFKNNLNDLLISKNKDLLSGLDARIILLLFQEKDFKKDLERAVLENKEEITSQKIMIDGRVMSGTTQNWLRDFIKEMGSGEINSLKTSNFLIRSDNARKISDDEKKKLRKLLTLYGNLKFFPESMGNVPSEEWEIIPIAKKEELRKAREAEIKKIEITEKEREEYRKGKAEKLEKKFSEKLEKKAIEEEILGKTETTHIEERKKELEEMMKKYDKKSLEYKAVKEELEKTR